MGMLEPGGGEPKGLVALVCFAGDAAGEGAPAATNGLDACFGGAAAAANGLAAAGAAAASPPPGGDAAWNGLAEAGATGAPAWNGLLLEAAGVDMDRDAVVSAAVKGFGSAAGGRADKARVGEVPKSAKPGDVDLLTGCLSKFAKLPLEGTGAVGATAGAAAWAPKLAKLGDAVAGRAAGSEKLAKPLALPPPAGGDGRGGAAPAGAGAAAAPAGSSTGGALPRRSYTRFVTWKMLTRALGSRQSICLMSPAMLGV
mmetsp:Transcript_35806/g.93716  ORF Transcript_35806/g.93716 Transcript_35806/m.93716 type:complete len:256 (-) Transcript_35806:892-1659(-)